MEKYINIRVLQHDEQDQIRIGESFPVKSDNIAAVVQKTIKQYDDRMQWCGGVQSGFERFYKRIAIVDAETLHSVTEIYNKKGK